MAKEVSIAVVGGGLSGWSAAYFMSKKASITRLRIDVFDAKHTVGGRAKSIGNVDVGGAWIWPSNTLARSLIDKLCVPHFEDTMAGNAVEGHSHVNITTHLSTCVTEVQYNHNNRVVLHWKNLETGNVDSTEVDLVALPSRLAAQSIIFSPPLPAQSHKAMLQLNIWMASMAKISLRFTTPWWTKGAHPINYLRAPSQWIAQLMDASTPHVNAIVAFTVPPPFPMTSPTYSTSPSELTQSTSEFDKWLRELVASIQAIASSRYFRVSDSDWKATLEYLDLYSWQHDQFIFSTDGIHKPGHDLYYQHPNDGGDVLREPIRFPDDPTKIGIVFAGSETDNLFPGFVEGALRAGRRCAEDLQHVN
ncbi:hypothetical protein Ae201684_005963 [Aphanomyces euteiches]|uniref:monoamine oxidase n=1 Tax=Aphanomyces euteiches TaxID=100861 RepID=A0A6G0XD30_9STRA|nr:hypothetical protein Ae201684_005963 [Aphanomyces euteiches]KAH9137566.1 hypothetical protein AeRB84_017768 [Aphanomyces euteiches]